MTYEEVERRPRCRHCGELIGRDWREGPWVHQGSRDRRCHPEASVSNEAEPAELLEEGEGEDR